MTRHGGEGQIGRISLSSIFGDLKQKTRSIPLSGYDRGSFMRLDGPKNIASIITSRLCGLMIIGDCAYTTGGQSMSMDDDFEYRVQKVVIVARRRMANYKAVHQGKRGWPCMPFKDKPSFGKKITIPHAGVLASRRPAKYGIGYIRESLSYIPIMNIWSGDNNRLVPFRRVFCA